MADRTILGPAGTGAAMAEIMVPREDRPSFAKFAVYAGVSIVVVSALAGQIARGAEGGTLAILVLTITGLANLTILFLMIQSLIEEWFAAAEIRAE